MKEYTVFLEGMVVRVQADSVEAERDTSLVFRVGGEVVARFAYSMGVAVTEQIHARSMGLDIRLVKERELPISND